MEDEGQSCICKKLAEWNGIQNSRIEVRSFENSSKNRDFSGHCGVGVYKDMEEDSGNMNLLAIITIYLQ